MDPSTLIRHEYTSRPHLESLLRHLNSLSHDALVPIPVVTKSSPHVILDGHHRVAASRVFGIPLIPVWVVDDADEQSNWEETLVRCYSRQDHRRMPLQEVVESARTGRIDWGIKGTKHVAKLAVESGMQMEIELERVTPRVLWGVWKSGVNQTTILSDSLSEIPTTM